MFDEVPLPLDWPVYVSHAEARAYAAWAGKRLPTEAEWQRAAQRVSPLPGPLEGYFDLERWDPFPVNAVPDSRSAFGVDGLLANGWEWTSSPFEPFPGFRPFPFYEGYSANFFDGQHYVMKGGSTRTERSILRPSFRNWFQPHYQYVYAGFRCAR
jgi:formylglycine-generating enzyme required for sulfatase activity